MSRWIPIVAILAFASLTSAVWRSPSKCCGQTIHFGPRFPGETIIHERVVSRGQVDSVDETAGTAEPMSGSDIAADAPRDEASVFSLGQPVWERLLDLERENAQLSAELNYERKLHRYLESSESKESQMRSRISDLEQVAKQAETKARQLPARFEAENRERQNRILDLEQELRRMSEAFKVAVRQQESLRESLQMAQAQLSTKIESTRRATANAIPDAFSARPKPVQPSNSSPAKEDPGSQKESVRDPPKRATEPDPPKAAKPEPSRKPNRPPSKPRPSKKKRDPQARTGGVQILTHRAEIG
ncbi:MAG: hypothetical protein AAF670_16405 [Planctomycetota bacterium]